MSEYIKRKSSSENMQEFRKVLDRLFVSFKRFSVCTFQQKIDFKHKNQYNVKSVTRNKTICLDSHALKVKTKSVY